MNYLFDYNGALFCVGFVNIRALRYLRCYVFMKIKTRYERFASHEHENLQIQTHKDKIKTNLKRFRIL